MTQKLIPPTSDFFSQQWYERDGFGMAMITEGLYSRIDSTRRKLSELESKLSQRLERNPYSPELRSFWDKVGWLRSYIGIWTTDSDEEGWNAGMEYPQSKQVISVWPQSLFGERKEGKLVLILLSSSSITWLNSVVHWLEVNEKELV